MGAPGSSRTFVSTARIAGTEDRVTVYAWKALAGSVIGFAMDGFDLLILGFMLAAISADLALTSAQAGSLVSWTLIGAVAGGLTFGTVSDHLGRIRVLTWTILIFAVFTGLCAFARGYWDLVVCRILAGLGLGGEFGIGMALATEAGQQPSAPGRRLMLDSAGRREFCWPPLLRPCCCR